MNRSELTARIFDIQGYSVHDGPGVRTTVFFKGCPLSCYWCCNPESQRVQFDLMYRRTNCVRCYNCLSHCSKGALSVGTPGEYVTIDRSVCKSCDTFDCVKGCYHKGYRIAGEIITLEALIKRIARDRRFWSAEGGVTLSGGEVMMQYEFVREFLRDCKERQIHTCIETCGFAPTDHYMGVLPYLDWIFTDVKHMDPSAHKEGTGVTNELILKNVKAIAQNKEEETTLIVRIPVIEGFNDTEENVCATADFVKECGLQFVNILPFHRMGSSKYEQLDIDYKSKEMTAPSEEHMQWIKGLVESRGVECYIGSTTPF